MSRRPRIQLCPLVLSLALSAGCSRERSDDPGQPLREPSACASACAGRGRATPVDRRCEAACLEWTRGRAKACREPLLAWFRCLSEVSDTDRRRGWPESWPKDPTLSRVCRDQAMQVDYCTKSCDEVGTLFSGEYLIRTDAGSKLVRFEAVAAGCEGCRPNGGAPQGAPCTAASVCSEICCRRLDGRSFQRVRACSDGRCLGATGCDAVVARAAAGRVER